jgi:4-hydroxy-3-methylbut-2-enyl diphosphate reductase
MTISVIEPHGFCAGVTAALKKALSLAAKPRDDSNPQTLKPSNPSLYCLHELVHNEIVVDELKKRGFTFVESLAEVPDGATVLFSAHGVAPQIREAAKARGIRVVDATCPFVERVHKAAREFAAKGLRVVVIGHPGHIEVKGIVGEVGEAVVISNVAAAKEFCAAAGTAECLGVVSQTTMNADEVAEIVAALKTRFKVETTAEVCNATKLRQDAVKAFGGDAVLVLGSASSSNTARLCECAPCKAFRAGTMDEVKSLDLSGVTHLGVTSGASTPEEFLKAAVAWLRGERT